MLADGPSSIPAEEHVPYAACRSARIRTASSPAAGRWSWSWAGGAVPPGTI